VAVEHLHMPKAQAAFASTEPRRLSGVCFGWWLSRTGSVLHDKNCLVAQFMPEPP